MQSAEAMQGKEDWQERQVDAVALHAGQVQRAVEGQEDAGHRRAVRRKGWRLKAGHTGTGLA